MTQDRQDPPHTPPQDSAAIDPQWRVAPLSGPMPSFSPTAGPDLPYSGPRFPTRDETFPPPEHEQFRDPARWDSVSEYKSDARGDFWQELREGRLTLGTALRLGASSAVLSNDSSPDQMPNDIHRDRQEGIIRGRNGEPRR